MERLRRQARSLRNAATDAERLLWQHMRRDQLGGFRFRRQMPIDRYIADFVCPRASLIVELDGGQHAEDRREYDVARTERLQVLGYRVLRYWNHDVMQQVDVVLEDILRHLTPPQPSPSPAAKGREQQPATSRAQQGCEQQPTNSRVAQVSEARAFAPSLSPKAKGRVGEGCLTSIGTRAGSNSETFGSDKQ